MRGRKPNPLGLRVIKAEEKQNPAQTPAKPNKGGRPPGRPPCPSYFSPAQRREFAFVCRELEGLVLLQTADLGDIASLALALDKLRETTEFLNESGSYYWITRPGRPYKCPACKGAAASRKVKCRACSNRGMIQGRQMRERVKNPEVIEQRNAQDLIVKISAALGLDPTSRVRLKLRTDKPLRSGLEDYLANGKTVRK